MSSGQIFVWDVATGKKLTEFAGSENFAYSPTENVIASDSLDYNLYFTDTKTGKKLGSLKSDFISAIEYSPDGRFIAIAGQTFHTQQTGVNNKINIIDSQTKEQLPIEMAGIPALVTDLAWNPTQEILASKDEQGNVQVWDLGNGSQVALFEEISMSPGDLAFNEDGSVIYVGGLDGTIGLISTSGSITADAQPAPATNAEPDVALIPYSHSSGAVTLKLPEDWKVEEKTPLSFVASSPEGTTIVAFLATNTNTPLSEESFTNFIEGSEQNLKSESEDYQETEKSIDGKNGSGYVTKTITLGGSKFLLLSYYYRKNAVVYQVYFFALENQFVNYIQLFHDVNASIKINSDFIEKQIPYEELNDINDTSGKFSFSYPQGWMINETGTTTDPATSFLAPDSSSGGSLELLPIPTGTQISDKKVHEMLIDHLKKKSTDFKVLSQGKTNSEGWQITYDMIDNGLSGVMSAIQVDDKLEVLNVVFDSNFAEIYQPLAKKIGDALKKQ